MVLKLHPGLPPTKNSRALGTPLENWALGCLPFTCISNQSQQLCGHVDRCAHQCVEETVNRLDQLDSFGEFATLLRSCANAKALIHGKRVHDYIKRNGLDGGAFIGALLVEMYLKCGAVEDAHAIFSRLRRRSSFSWNLIIRSYTEQGQEEEALQSFSSMLGEGILPDKYTIVSILSTCISVGDSSEIQRIHACIVGSVFESDVVVGNALLNAYGKCGNLMYAQKVFDGMPQHDAVSWNSLVVACVQNGMDKETFYLFGQMQQQSVLPTRVTFVSILNTCTNQEDLVEGERMHASVIGRDFEEDVVLGTALVNMYGKCGNFENAWRLFNEMPQRNLVSWNTMIAVCDHLSQGMAAFQLYSQMLREGMMPNRVTFMSILSTLATPTALFKGQHLHACMVGSGFQSDIDVENALVNMYSKCGSLEQARRIFDEMPERNVVSWTIMIVGYAVHGQSKTAIQHFHQMQEEGVLADKLTIISILDAYAGLAFLSRGRQMHACIVGDGLECDLGMKSALINMYGKCGSLNDAWRIFHKIYEHNVITWTAMINAHSQHGHADKAIELFYQMQQEGIMANNVTFVSVLDACAREAALPQARRLHVHILANGFESNCLVGTALVDMYGKCGSLDDSQTMFDKVLKQDVVLWTSLIAAYARNGKGREALRLFDQMQQKGVRPDNVTYINVLSVCSHIGLVDEGCRYFGSMSSDNGITASINHYSCMIDLFGRAGRLHEAEDMINSLPFPPTALPWMTLLGVCRYQLDVERGERAAKRVFELDPENPAPYVMLSNLYAATNRGTDAAKLISRMKETIESFRL